MTTLAGYRLATVRFATLVALVLGLTACSMISTLIDGWKYAKAVEADLEGATGVKPSVGFNWSNGRLATVTVAYPQLYERKPLAALAGHQGGFRTLVIDADPQGSLTLWHSLRPDRQPDLRSGARGIERALAMAVVDGYQWVFIDTAASMWVVAQEAIRAATMVLIPARPGFFDLNAVRETVAAARNKPYAVVLNATPVKRDDKEAPAVLQSRAFFEGLGIPVWGGQVSHRTGFVLTLAAGASIGEVAPTSAAGSEMNGLWSAVERSVAAINAAHAAPGAAHKQAAA